MQLHAVESWKAQKFVKKGGKTEGEPARVRREGRDVWRQTPKTQPQERRKMNHNKKRLMNKNTLCFI